MPVSRPRTCVALTSSPLPYRTRNPTKFTRDRAKILAAFASFQRELSMGEVGCYVLTMTSAVDRDEVLGDLVAEGLLLVREVVCQTAMRGISRYYRRPQDPEGGQS